MSPKPASREWTNRSVQQLAGDRDPVTAVSGIVADLLLAAADADPVGSPTNPFELARLMGIPLRPHFDVADARLVAGGRSDPTSDPANEAEGAPLRRYVPSKQPLVIEYNPTRPRGRLRYSVAHELAHALFPDASEEVRRRTHTGAVEELAVDDSWQLELLCNIAAAELLMPTDAVEGLVNSATDIDFLMAQRARFAVSTEALLRRLVHATDRPMALAAFSRVEDSHQSGLRCEYVLGSRSWTGSLGRGMVVPSSTVLAIPTAVGQTARGGLPESATGRELRIQAVGVPPYPGRRLPRVLALAEPAEATPAPEQRIRFITADIADTVHNLDNSNETAPIVVAHVVPDTSHAWGRYGAAGALGQIAPTAAAAFRNWSIADQHNLELGNVHVVDVPTGTTRRVTVASMVAQRGHGPSATPRLSYTALAEALEKVAARAAAVGAEVHIPRIGAGQAGGRWDLIQAAIERSLLDRGVSVVVYTLPPRANDGGAARSKAGA